MAVELTAKSVAVAPIIMNMNVDLRAAHIIVYVLQCHCKECILAFTRGGLEVVAAGSTGR